MTSDQESEATQYWRKRAEAAEERGRRLLDGVRRASGWLRLGYTEFALGDLLALLSDLAPEPKSRIGRVFKKGNPNRGYSLSKSYTYVFGPVLDGNTWGVWNRNTGEVVETTYNPRDFMAEFKAQERGHELNGTSRTPTAELLDALDSEG